MPWTTKVAAARDALEVTPNDAANLPKAATLGLYVGTQGDVRLQTVGGVAAVTYKNCPAGSYIRAHVVKVFATGTTASNIVAES